MYEQSDVCFTTALCLSDRPQSGTWTKRQRLARVGQHLGGVYHEGDSASLGISNQQIYKARHSSNALYEAIVHIDVQKVSTLFNLRMKGYSETMIEGKVFCNRYIK